MADNHIPRTLKLRNMVTRDYLVSVLDYDPVDGTFCWKWRDDIQTQANVRFAGKAAGWMTRFGHRQITINGTHFLASHLVWRIVTGEFPPEGKDVDHKNRNPGDDRWRNLRLATKSENFTNKGCYKNNKSGLKGVTLRKDGTFQAWVYKNKSRYFLGTFKTAEEAHRAYRVGAEKLHGEFVRFE